VGSHFGSGHTDNAGTCSIDEFLNGTFNEIVRDDLGEEILCDILKYLHERISILKTGREL